MIKCSEHTKWTEEDRTNNIGETVRFLSKLLKDAKVDSVDRSAIDVRDASNSA